MDLGFINMLIFFTGIKSEIRVCIYACTCPVCQKKDTSVSFFFLFCFCLFFNICDIVLKRALRSQSILFKTTKTDSFFYITVRKIKLSPIVSFCLSKHFFFFLIWEFSSREFKNSTDTSDMRVFCVFFLTSVGLLWQLLNQPIFRA